MGSLAECLKLHNFTAEEKVYLKKQVNLFKKTMPKTDEAAAQYLASSEAEWTVVDSLLKKQIAERNNIVEQIKEWKRPLETKIDKISDRIIEQYPEATEEEIDKIIDKELDLLEAEEEKAEEEKTPEQAEEEIPIAELTETETAFIDEITMEIQQSPDITDEEIGNKVDEIIDMFVEEEIKGITDFATSKIKEEEGIPATIEMAEEEVSPATEEVAEPLPLPLPALSVPEIINDINETLGEKGEIGGEGIDTERIEEDVWAIGQMVWEEGKTKIEEWTARVKEYAGDTWEKIKDIVIKIYENIKAFNEGMGERGALGYEEPEIPQVKTRDVKKIIESVNTVKQSEELKNLKYAFIKAQRASKEGYKAGEKSGKETGRQEILNPTKTIKQLIKETTGITKPEDITNLKYGYRMAGRAAKAGEKFGKTEQRLFMKARLKENADYFKDLKTMKSIKEKHTGKIALDYQDKLDNIFKDIDFIKPTGKTYARLSGLADFIDEEGVPLGISHAELNELKRLSQIPFRDLSEPARKSLLERAKQFYDQGKLKRKLQLNKEERAKQKKLITLTKGTINLDPTLSGEKEPTKWDVTKTFFKRTHMDLLHTFRQADIADGNQDYQGENAGLIKEEMKREITIKSKLNNEIEKLVKEIQATGIEEIDEDMMKRITINLMLEQDARTQAQELMYDYDYEDVPAVNARERQVMDIVRKYASSITDDIVKVYEKRENQRFPKVHNYFMIKYLKDYMVSPTEEIRHDRYRTKEVAQGFTLTRKPDVKLSPRIDFMAVLEEGLYAQYWYAYMQPLIDEHASLTHTPEYKAAAGIMMWNWWKDQIDIVSRKGWSASARPNPFLRQTRINMNLAVMGFKATTTVVQPFAIFETIAYAESRWGLDAAKDIALEFTRSWLNPSQAIKSAENIPVLKLRKGGEIAVEETMEKKGEYEKYRKAAMIGIKLFDLITAQGSREGLLKVLNKHNIANAEDEADFLMNLTNGSTEVTIRPHILSKGEGWKTWFTFQNFALNHYGLIIHDLIGTGFKGNWKRKLNTGLAMLILMAGGKAEDEIRELIYEWTTGKKASMTDEDLLEWALLYYPRQIPLAGRAFEKYPKVQAPAIRAVEKGLSGLSKTVTGIKNLEGVGIIRGGLDSIESLLTLHYGVAGTAQMFDIMERAIPDKDRKKTKSMNLFK